MAVDETGTETRICNICKAAKPLTVEHWPIDGGRPKPGRCRLCVRASKKAFDRKARQTRVAARTQQLATLADPALPPASGGAVSTTKDRLPAELPLRQLEVVKALREGAQFLNGIAKTALDTLAYYAADPTHPHHEWAIKLVADRVLPKKLYEDLGAKEAGLGKPGEGGTRPTVTIIVQQATAPGPVDVPVVKVVDGESKRVD